jgi:hypothetical protein
MRVSSGACKINGVHVVSVDVDNMRSIQVRAGVPTSPQMTATYATVEGTAEDAVKGTQKTLLHTHGKCSAQVETWSERTLNLLNELLDSMEQDLLPYHFSEGASAEEEDARTGLGTNEKPDQI